MPCDLVAFAAVQGGPLHDVHSRAIVPLHIEIARHEVLRLPMVEVARDGERLQEHFGHDHRAPEIEHDAAIVQAVEARRQASKIPVARVADRCAVRAGMLMNDFGTDRGVHGDWNAVVLRAQQNG